MIMKIFSLENDITFTEEYINILQIQDKKLFTNVINSLNDNINNIELVNLSESVQTMYPMLTSSFGDIKKAVMESGSTANITYDSANKYTSSLLLGAIQSALDKAAAH